MSSSQFSLVVIGDKECSGTTAYLMYLKKNGYRVSKLLLCSFYKPLRFANIYQKAAYRFNKKIYRQIFDRVPEIFSPLVRELCRRFQDLFDIKINFNSSEIDYASLAEHVEHHKFWDFNDPSLLEVLQTTRNSIFLYTSGGIVPRTVFREGIRMLHVHPGYVPFVRGSDGMLWSLLTRGKLGYSCFFMSEGIDQGALLFRHEREMDNFSAYKILAHTYPDDFYRALLSGYDPHLRAQTLILTLKKYNGKPRIEEAFSQESVQGCDYYRMHPRLIKKTLQEFVD